VSAPPLLALAGQEGVQPKRFRMIVHLVAALVVRSRGLAKRALGRTVDSIGGRLALAGSD